MNSCIFTGRLTADPETRYTNDGKAVTTFNLAVDDGYGDNKTTSFLRMVLFGKTAESAEKYLSKGRKVAVMGRAKQNTWTDKDGNKRQSVDFIITAWEFCDSKSGETKENLHEAKENLHEVKDSDEFMDFPDNEELPFN